MRAGHTDHRDAGLSGVHKRYLGLESHPVGAPYYLPVKTIDKYVMLSGSMSGPAGHCC